MLHISYFDSNKVFSQFTSFLDLLEKPLADAGFKVAKIFIRVICPSNNQLFFASINDMMVVCHLLTELKRLIN